MQFASWRHYGSAEFLRAYNALQIPIADRPGALARWLDVSPRTVADWISGRHCPPRATVYALWLESDDGRAYVAMDLANECRLLASLVSALKDASARKDRTIAELRAELIEAKAAAPGARLAINDAIFCDDSPPPPVTPKRPRFQRA